MRIAGPFARATTCGGTLVPAWPRVQCGGIWKFPFEMGEGESTAALSAKIASGCSRRRQSALNFEEKNLAPTDVGGYGGYEPLSLYFLSF